VKNGEKKGTGSLPDLIDSKQEYRNWVELGKELVDIGEISRARKLLFMARKIGNIYKDF